MASAAKTLRVSFVQCRGTPYEVGRAQADAFAETRKGKAFLRKKVRLPAKGHKRSFLSRSLNWAVASDDGQAGDRGGRLTHC